MKRSILVLTGILLTIQVFPQKKYNYEKAPLNPNFVKYKQAKHSGILKSSAAEGYKLDYVPSPMYLHFSDNQSSSGVLKSTEDFPTSYDLRDVDQKAYVTVPKDQGSGEAGGNCVAFATMGTIESRWLVMGDIEYDLSEQNIAACYGYEWGFGEGANAIMATAYLSRFSGPVLDSQNPYNLSSYPCLDIDPVKLVPEARFLPNNKDVIKKAIMDYGAVWASVHIDDGSFDYTFNTYYYDGEESPNHAWMVVGWDDFKLTLGGIGAWIIKNSWSDEWAEDGYIYCSYDDVAILSDAAQWNTRWETTAVDHLYMYDRLGALTSSGYGDDFAYGLAKFEAPEEQLVTEIGTFINSQGAVIEIEIYDDFDGNELTNLLNSSDKIYVEFPGFYTFELPTDVNGDFYVMVRYHTPNFNFPIPLEEFIEDYANPVIDTGVNWTSAAGKNWNSTNPDPENDRLGENLTIRAYAVDKGSSKALFKSDKETACLNSDVTYTFLENGSPSSYSWDFGQGATPATANTKGPHVVTYSTEGRKTVSLTVDGSETLTRYGYVDVSTEIDVIIPEDTITGPRGIDYEITAFGADTYSWSPSQYLDTDEGQTVIFNSDKEGTFNLYVEGTQGTCNDRDTLTLIMRIPPPNDNVCDAIELESPPSHIKGVTNRNATVEFNEPFPPEGDCETEGFWCIEGGLQNSIWFWFTAETEIVTFDGKGMDNQIAIYEAETCEDILNDNYTMIAAFDDYPGRLDFSFWFQTDVEIGKKYYVQIDGSAGGDEGTFRLRYLPWPLGIEDAVTAGGIDIYPNPSEGTFNIRVKHKAASSLLIEVYNISGQLVYEESYCHQAINSEIKVNLSDKSPGIYQVRMVMGESVIHQKIILQ